jgi:hypothetical protein
MLVYLQLILLFEEKDDRVYWLVAGLSLLQVVAATAFSQGVWFAVLVVVYLLVGLSALALLVLYRQWHRYQPEMQPPPPPRAADARRWPLAGQPPSFTTTSGGPAQAGVGREFFARLGGIGLGTLVLAILLFLTLPRLGVSAWRGTLPNPTHVVGFSDQVTLGELGETIQSNDEVMRVRFFDDARNPYQVNGEIYLYGAALLEYSQGQWKTHTSTSRGSRSTLARDKPLPAGLVQQRCEIEPLDRDELFYVMPVVPTHSDVSVRVDPNRGRLERAHYYHGLRFAYGLGTTALVGGVQQPLVPNVQIATTDEALQLPEGGAPGGLPSLTALANRWIAESGLPPDDRVGRARYLEQKLAASGQFEYSLQGQPRDLSIDPIEDFIANNPRGHCEYFATALTLMLRSQQIPARMIVGYKCDEFNELGHFYQIRQSHAHTWVEAYLPPDDLPAELLHGKDYWPWESAGGWLRLDPTPPAGDAAATGTFAVIIQRVNKAVDWLQTLWSNYVLEMERERQQEAIYQPVVHAVRHALRSLSNPQWWRALAEKIGQALSTGQGGLAHWMRLILVLLLGLLAVGLSLWRLGRLVRRLGARLAGWAAPAAGTHRSHVEFYRRLEVLLARHGLVRAASETQQEFAAAAGAKIASATGRPHLALLPPRVVGAFYRVRFGRLPLDSSQSEAVEHALAELAACGEKQ